MGRRDHTKLLVKDGQIMKTGDTNTGNEYMGFGEATRKIAMALAEYYNFRTQKSWDAAMSWLSKAEPVKNATFLHDPVGQKGYQPGMDRGVLEFMRSAKHELKIFSPYLILPSEEKRVIREALARGVKIEIYTNSVFSSDNYMTQSAYEMRLHEIAALGDIKIFEYQGPETWHGKVMVRDSSRLQRSFFYRQFIYQTPGH